MRKYFKIYNDKFRGSDINKFRGSTKGNGESSILGGPLYINNVQDKFLSIESRGCRKFEDRDEFRGIIEENGRVSIEVQKI